MNPDGEHVYRLCLGDDALYRELNRLGLGTDTLALSIAPFRACNSDRMYWLALAPDQPNRFALILNEIGYLSHQVTLITSAESQDAWRACVMSHPWLRTGKHIEIQLYGEDVTANASSISENSGIQQSTQFILDFSRWDSDKSLSTNMQRNLKKAAKQCDVVEINSEQGVSDYVQLVHSSDERRASLGQKNAKHSHDGLRSSVMHGCSSLYFAQCDGVNVSSVRINKVADRAYYVMGGTSAHGFSIGASPFLLISVANKLKAIGFKSLTLGLANSDGLKSFKLGLGAYPVQTLRYPLPSSPMGTWSILLPAFKLALVIIRIKRFLGALVRKLYRYSSESF